MSGTITLSQPTKTPNTIAFALSILMKVMSQKITANIHLPIQ